VPPVLSALLWGETGPSFATAPMASPLLQAVAGSADESPIPWPQTPKTGKPWPVAGPLHSHVEVIAGDRRVDCNPVSTARKGHRPGPGAGAPLH
jgi:hypothetical protein